MKEFLKYFMESYVVMIYEDFPSSKKKKKILELGQHLITFFAVLIKGKMQETPLGWSNEVSQLTSFDLIFALLTHITYFSRRIKAMKL